MGSHTVTIKPPERSSAFGSGVTQTLVGFGIIILAGTLLLMLPAAAADGHGTGFLDSLFTAVSAISGTGLVVVDTQEHWTFLGELMVLLIIQIGGLGYMFATAAILWILGRRLGVRDRHMLRLYYGAPTAAETVAFARRIVAYALIVEAVGAVVLFFGFWGAGVSPGTSVWWSIFHSVSAFNAAGFSITGADMVPYREETAVLLPLGLLAIAGSVGAIPVLLSLRLRSFRRLPIDSKLILGGIGSLLLLTTLLFAAWEWDNARTLGTVSPSHRPLLAFFQASMWTAGFSAVDMAAIGDHVQLYFVGFMFIGGAPGSTAGGIKVGTFLLLLFAMVATMRGEERVLVFGRAVPPRIVRQALVISLLGVAFVFALATALIAVGDAPGYVLFFENMSAIATVGWTVGAVAASHSGTRILLIVGMLGGRFGPLLLVLVMNRPRKKSTLRPPSDSIRLG